MNKLVLYRPVGTKELELIAASGYLAFPPRLPEQPIFYPVTNETYAVQIARDWNCKYNDDHKGYVTRFAVDAEYADTFQRRVVGGSEHEELWVPAEQLSNFNAEIIGMIEVIHSFALEGSVG